MGSVRDQKDVFFFSFVVLPQNIRETRRVSELRSTYTYATPCFRFVAELSTSPEGNPVSLVELEYERVESLSLADERASFGDKRFLSNFNFRGLAPARTLATA